MTQVRTFRGSLVNPEVAHEVVAPAYDSMTADQRARYAEAHPRNYLNVMRTQEDYSEGVSVEEILNQNKRNLENLIETRSFSPQPDHCFVIYRLISAGHQQTGLVAEIPVQEVDDGLVLKHELTRRDREELLVQYQSHVGVSSSPIALAYHARPEISSLLERITDTTDPYLDYLSQDGVRQILWRVESDSDQQEIARLFSAISLTYLTDGHHRAAAASRYRKLPSKNGVNNQTDSSRDDLLVALFPDDELAILPFNRVVKDLNGLSATDFLQQLGKEFLITHLSCDANNPAKPDAAGNFIMVLGDDCYQLTLKDVQRSTDNPVANLDVIKLQELILDPLLGIADARGDARLEYVSGSTGSDSVNNLRLKGWQVAFYCHPISMQELMAVSDAGQVMPPKSTCFEPKVRSGLFLLQK